MCGSWVRFPILPLRMQVRLHTIRRSRSGVQFPALESLTRVSKVTQRSVTVAREKLVLQILSALNGVTLQGNNNGKLVRTK